MRRFCQRAAVDMIASEFVRRRSNTCDGAGQPTRPVPANRTRPRCEHVEDAIKVDLQV